ncbi:MAG: alpha-L-fucosidase [Spirochaetota bacterium]
MEHTLEPWWNEGKLGLFIHWGLYSILAGEYLRQRTDNIAEWIMHDLHIPPREYERLAEEFDPKNFDTDFLVRLARDAGMRYMVFTAKHHEGFAMYDSRTSWYNCRQASPFARDALAELRDACNKYGLKLGIYYSQAQDWSDPDACEDGEDGRGKNFEMYFQSKCLPQIKELLTNYGEVSLLWLDTPMYMTFEQSQRLRDYIKTLQPRCLISGRIGNGLGDYLTTGDNFIPALPSSIPFEVPATINGTWGFSKHDMNWKSTEEILRSLVKVVSRGGNYLLNVGPNRDGMIPEECVKVLLDIGSFINQNGESIYDTNPVPFYPYDIEWGYFTCRPGKLYIHIFKIMDTAYLLNIANKPVKAYRLSDKLPLVLKERTTCEGDSSWLIKLPPRLPGEIDQVVCVEMVEDDVVFEPIRR